MLGQGRRDRCGSPGGTVYPEETLPGVSPRVGTLLPSRRRHPAGRCALYHLLRQAAREVRAVAGDIPLLRPRTRTGHKLFHSFLGQDTSKMLNNSQPTHTGSDATRPPTAAREASTVR